MTCIIHICFSDINCTRYLLAYPISCAHILFLALILNRLLGFSEVFVADDDGYKRKLRLTKHLEDGTPEERTNAVAVATLQLKNEEMIKGWRNELVPVVSAFSSPVAFAIERASYPYFGIKGYGVHVNGFVRGITGNIDKIWVATRSKKKSTWPGMLDHIVAGGIVNGIG